MPNTYTVTLIYWWTTNVPCSPWSACEKAWKNLVFITKTVAKVLQ